MWLRNYYNMLTALMLADDAMTSSTQPTDYDPPIMVRRPNGVWADAQGSHILSQNTSSSLGSYFPIPFVKGGQYSTAGYASSATPSNIYGAMSFQCGSGTTPATYDDYVLETPITSGLSLVNSQGTLTQATTYNNVSHHISSKRSYTINNTSASSITISEFGIYAQATSNTVPVLIYRDVFTPITLAPGESAIVSVERDSEVYNYTPY